MNVMRTIGGAVAVVAAIAAAMAVVNVNVKRRERASERNVRVYVLFVACALCCHLESLIKFRPSRYNILFSRENGERGRQNILNQSSGVPKVA